MDGILQPGISYKINSKNIAVSVITSKVCIYSSSMSAIRSLINLKNPVSSEISQVS